MRGRSVKRNERILLAATLIVFLLLLVLKITSTSLFLSFPFEAQTVGGGYSQKGPFEKEISLREPTPTEPNSATGLTSATEPTAGEKYQLPQTKVIPNTPGFASSVEAAPAVAGTGPPYTLGEAQRRDLRVRLIVSNKGNATSTNIRMDVPLLGELDSPYQNVLHETFSHPPQEIKQGTLGNRNALFQINAIAPGKSETLTLNYQLQSYPLKSELPTLAALSTSQVYYPASPASYPTVPIPAPGQRGLETGAWLKPGAKIESDHPEIIARACELTAPAQDQLEKARLIFNYVRSHVRYDLSSPHRNKGALSALRTATGVCEDYATLFVALCRASGIPARQVNGYADPHGHGTTWQLAPAETLSLKGCRHSWAEFYLEGIGWLPADPTFNLHENKLTYFTSLPQAGHLAQNYADQPLRVRFQGGQIAVSWEEELAGL